jgi:hypothetical protein
MRALPVTGGLITAIIAQPQGNFFHVRHSYLQVVWNRYHAQALDIARLAPNMQYLRSSAIFDSFESERKRNMRRLFTIATLAAISATLALAEDWSGKLLDISCLDQKKAIETCQANGMTTAFALQVADKTYRLDDAGNQKAITSLKDRADRATDPAAAAAPVNAKITGARDGDVLKVDSIEVQ